MDNSGNQLIEQLILDPSFRDWVLNRPGADRQRWAAWEKRHVGQAGLIRSAKAVILALQVEENHLPEAELEHALDRIRTGIAELSPAVRANQESWWRRNTGAVKRIAAVFILMALGLGWLLTGPGTRQEPAIETLTRIQQLPPPSGKYENHSDTVVRIRLPDKSLVHLYGNSTITYKYLSGERAVVLSGEAFFEVFRQPARPFLVQTGEIVTRVLGTSFRIQARPGHKETEVSVTTGKVYVARADDAATALILTPNQRVRYDKKRHQLEKGLVDAPQPVWKPARQRFFHFDRTPLEQVFKELQKVYGIPIIYDEDIVASCSLSATMGEEPFFEKLKLICKVVNASYQVLDGSVVIYAKGCN